MKGATEELFVKAIYYKKREGLESLLESLLLALSPAAPSISRMKISYIQYSRWGPYPVMSQHKPKLLSIGGEYLILTISH